MTKIVPIEFSSGLRTVLQKYCAYRGWQRVAPKTASDTRLLIERAGSVEETIEGLKWFFSSKFCDHWVQEVRPELSLSFLIEHWDRYEIAKGEWKPRSNYYSFAAGVNEYAVMRGLF